jgi:hypothetical protein
MFHYRPWKLVHTGSAFGLLANSENASEVICLTCCMSSFAANVESLSRAWVIGSRSLYWKLCGDLWKGV